LYSFRGPFRYLFTAVISSLLPSNASLPFWAVADTQPCSPKSPADFTFFGANMNLNLGDSAADNVHVPGRLGVGTSAASPPGAGIHVRGSGFPSSFLFLDTTVAGQDSGIRLYENAAVKGHIYWDASAGTINMYQDSPYAGLQILAGGEARVTGQYLRVNGAGNEQAYIGGDGAGSDVQIGSTRTGIRNIALWNTADARRMDLYVRQIYIMGGADLAEPFKTHEHQAIEPGMLVTIDSDNPGALKMSCLW